MVKKKKKNNKPNPIKQELKQALKERIAQLRGQELRVRAFLVVNPDYPYEQKEKDIILLSKSIDIAETMYEELMPFVHMIQSHVEDITDQKLNTAIYLLLGGVSNRIEAIMLLARKGFHHEVMELIRSNEEALDLAYLFLAKGESSRELQKWYAGAILHHSKSRNQKA